MVWSVLVGGRDIGDVLKRNDGWYCIFYDNYGCAGDEDDMLVICGGDNNLITSGWDTRVHSIRCVNEGD